MSDLLAKNIILNGDIKREPQVAVALKEITNERLVQELYGKLKKAQVNLREAIGEAEVVPRRERVEYLKSLIRNAKKQIRKAKEETIFVPVKD